MRHCQNCNRDYSDNYFRKHCRSNNHLKKAFEVKYIYKTENILVNEIDNTLSNIVKNHQLILHSFYIVSKINNKKIEGFPKRILIKHYDKNEKINTEFNLYSNIEDMTFNYYILQPKSMLETTMIKILDRYPQKLKILKYSKVPYYEYLIIKYYGFVMVNGGEYIYGIFDDWMSNEPKEPNNF